MVLVCGFGHVLNWRAGSAGWLATRRPAASTPPAQPRRTELGAATRAGTGTNPEVGDGATGDGRAPQAARAAGGLPKLSLTDNLRRRDWIPIWCRMLWPGTAYWLASAALGAALAWVGYANRAADTVMVRFLAVCGGAIAVVSLLHAWLAFLKSRPGGSVGQRDRGRVGPGPR
jgi:hypothetical protein